MGVPGTRKRATIGARVNSKQMREMSKQAEAEGLMPELENPTEMPPTDTFWAIHEEVVKPIQWDNLKAEWDKMFQLQVMLHKAMLDMHSVVEESKLTLAIWNSKTWLLVKQNPTDWGILGRGTETAITHVTQAQKRWGLLQGDLVGKEVMLGKYKSLEKLLEVRRNTIVNMQDAKAKGLV